MSDQKRVTKALEMHWRLKTNYIPGPNAARERKQWGTYLQNFISKINADVGGNNNVDDICDSDEYDFHSL